MIPTAPLPNPPLPSQGREPKARGCRRSYASPPPTQATTPMATRYYIAIPDTDKARAAGEFAFRSRGPESMAQALQDELRTTALFEPWRATPDDPDAVEPPPAPTDPPPTATGP